MNVHRFLKKRPLFIFTVMLVMMIILTACGNPGSPSTAQVVKKNPTPTPTPTQIPTPTPIPPTPTPTFPPVVSSSVTLGIDGNAGVPYAGIPWVRLSYPTCGWGNLKGSVLHSKIQAYHQQGVRVMLSICQWTSGPKLFDMANLTDAAQGGADAVQCGNEQMKYSPDNMYIPPTSFARFFDNCQRAMHAVRPEIPVIIGSLDPHVSGADYGALIGQVGYLNSMQYAMNTQVHPGGNWNWHSQIVGLIDSWHNGYPNASVNNLYGLFLFWAQQFGVDLNSGALGKHLWVIEGTGCFKGCGINPYSGYEVGVSHILTLITDVQTAMGSHVPFFYFSGKDFNLEGIIWPIGILDIHSHPKPLRQDLWMGARTLTMSCAVGQRVVTDQLQLLARMYSGCTLPGNYVGILAS